jgi:hypothetical protein
MAAHTTTTLNSLPIELLNNVTRHLDAFADFAALRQTCKEISYALEELFLSKYFKLRNHALTLRGLQTLVAITTVPRLAIEIKEIHLAALGRLTPRPKPLPKPKMRKCFKFMPDLQSIIWEEEFFSSDEDDSADEDDEVPEVFNKDFSPVRDVMSAEEIAVSEAVRTELKVLDDKGENGMQALLTAIFANLAASPNTGVSVLLSQDVVYSPIFKNVYGIAGAEERLQGVRKAAARDYSEAAVRLLVAMARSSPRAHSLSLRGDVHPNKSAVEGDSDSSTDCLLDARTLTSLRLHLDSGMGKDRVYYAEPPNVYVPRLLQGAPNLEDLQISYNGGDCSWLKTAVKSTKVRILKVGHFSTNPKELIGFLQKHEGTLKELFLDDTALEGWNEVFEYVRDHLMLEKLTLSALRCEQGVLMRGDRSRCWTCHSFKGQEAVKTGIGMVLAGKMFVWK